MLRIEMLPAQNGDCLWIEYGLEDSPRRILIDGGTHATYEPLRQRIEALDRDERTFQLLVITHIDNDHIDGIVRLLQNPQIGYRFRDIWFNGWPQLDDPEGDALGPVQGEYVAARLRNRGLPWNQNRRLGRSQVRDEPPAVVIAQKEKLPRIPLAGDLALVLLSPTPDKLTRLRKKWKSIVTVAEKGYPDPGSSDAWLRRLEEDSRYQPDDEDDALGPAKPPDMAALLKAKSGYDGSAANGSSIAFLLEYGDKRCLLAGDAHPKVLADSLELYLAEKGVGRLPVDAFKLPHHGSKNNVSKRLLDLLDCPRYLVSTDSSGQAHHPDDEAVARILAYGGDDKVLYFNYRVDQTEKWDDDDLRTRYSYRPRYPPRNRPGIAVTL